MGENVYARVTSQILDQLTKGTAPWQQPWKLSVGAPRSLATGKPYRGINALLLGLEEYASPYWATYKQIKDRGGHVRKNENGTSVVLWRQITVKDDTAKNGVKRVPLIRNFTVFNLMQAADLEKVPADAFPEAKEVAAEERHANAERIVTGFQDAPQVLETGKRAVYFPSEDRVHVPPRGTFTTLDEFYSTLFHELGHSTGHPKRLDRKYGQAFGDHAYGREELVAEMTSAFLQAEAGIEIAQQNSASYLNGWRKVLQEDEKAIVVAAGAAQRATDLILGRTFAKSDDEQGDNVQAGRVAA